jgi:hypothetical protein
VLRRARAAENHALTDALDHVTSRVNEEEFADLFAELARVRGDVADDR